jgi:hypothetical protein
MMRRRDQVADVLKAKIHTSHNRLEDYDADAVRFAHWGLRLIRWLDRVERWVR